MLEVHNLQVSYGGLRAVHGVSLEVRNGEIVSIIGANGAGKSSILNAISGTAASENGSILFRGEAIEGLPPHAAVARGIVQVPEGRMIFGSLSVEENLHAANYQRSQFLIRKGQFAKSINLFPSLIDKLHLPAASLSGGEAQMLALARGLQSNPKLLLLDEPSLGLSPKMAAEVFSLIDKLRQEGLTVLLVEQNVRQTLALADRAYVLESGQITLQGSAQELLHNDHLVSNYLGIAAHTESNTT